MLVCTTGLFKLTLVGTSTLTAFTVFEGFHGHADYPFAKPAYSPRHVVSPDTAVECLAPAHPYVAPERLPTCDSLEEPGRWVKPPEGPELPSGPRLGDWPTRWVKRGIVFSRSWGGNMVWMPYDCRYTQYTQDQVVEKIHHTRIIYIGDSQTRSMFYPLVNTLNQNKILGNPKIVDQNPNAQGWIEFPVRGNNLVRYSLDNFLSGKVSQHSPTWHSFITAPQRQWDVVIAGMGNWAMCGNLANRGIGLWSLHRYHAEIDRIAKELREYAQRTGTRVIWHNQPSFPWDVDPYRNGARLRLFNAYSMAVMKAQGFEVFDTFNVSDGKLPDVKRDAGFRSHLERFRGGFCCTRLSATPLDTSTTTMSATTGRVCC
eukprot:NODE_1073_length_1294_cov_62.413655_g882_i0.p1 GENE.NODE_1073_length_1294_cov_62.413655_g882_i0~~NODE_1073_length_1294_cov_62.413655_g882_i0.p1  ORF type:complete len:372 (+),score=42.28 NODE_1073_length_1294_cov_62.413655_g882_i0:106-1221(+)